MNALLAHPWSPSIQAALAELTALPAHAGHIAAFDFDNTCVLRDAGEAAFLLGLVRGMALRFDLPAFWELIDPQDDPDTLRALVATLLPLSPQARRVHPDWPRYLGHMGGLYLHHCRRDGDRDGFAWIVRLMVGLTPAQVHTISADTLRRQLSAPLTDQTWTDHTGQPFTVHMGLRPFKPVRDLVAWLDQQGITPWIVSASNPWTVAAAAPLIGIPPARVIGLTTATRDGLLTAELDGPITYRQGKVDALDQRGLPRPALSVGDAWTDWELLCAAQRAAILLDKGDAALREAAQKHGILVQERALLEPDHLAHLDPVPRPAIYAVGADLTHEAIALAAHAIWDANLVAMPTETVYGLAADALNPAAIARIYAAKGRPATNPLILHAPDTASARKLAASWPDAAQRLADAFWPGPLTLVLPRAAHVPTLATAGADTVALRVPAHPVARALLEACGTPLAAPSANRSNHISPTNAAHVAASLGPHVDLILDAGPCDVGLESTIVSLVGPPTVLRPGMITLDQLRQHLPDLQHKADLSQPDDATPHAAPGQSRLHYAPVTPAALLPHNQTPSGHRVGLLTYGPQPGLSAAPHGHTLTLPDDPAGYARGLYDALHTLDSMSLDHIAIHAPPDDEPWAAARDRLSRAAGGHT